MEERQCSRDNDGQWRNGRFDECAWPPSQLGAMLRRQLERDERTFNEVILNSIVWQRLLPRLVVGIFYVAADDWAADDRDYRGADGSVEYYAAEEAAAVAQARRVRAAFLARFPDEDVPLLRYSRNLTDGGERTGGFEAWS